MVVLSKAPVATALAWGEDNADEEGLYGMLSLIDAGQFVCFVKSVVIVVDDQEEEFVQICSLDVFFPLILIVPIDQLEVICQQYGVEFQHLDEIYEDHFRDYETSDDVPIVDKLQKAQETYRRVMATDHTKEALADRVKNTAASVTALNHAKIEGMAAIFAAHMDNWVSAFIILGVFDESSEEQIALFFSQFDG